MNNADIIEILNDMIDEQSTEIKAARKSNAITRSLALLPAFAYVALAVMSYKLEWGGFILFLGLVFSIIITSIFLTMGSDVDRLIRRKDELKSLRLFFVATKDREIDNDLMLKAIMYDYISSDHPMVRYTTRSAEHVEADLD